MARDLVIKVTLVGTEGSRGFRDGGEGRGVGEEGIEMLDWIITSCSLRQSMPYQSVSETYQNLWRSSLVRPHSDAA